MTAKTTQKTEDEGSLAERLVMSGKWKSFIAKLTPQERKVAEHDWRLWARPKQLPPPGDWLVWLLLSGRGFGKTRTGSEYVRSRMLSGEVGQATLIGPTAADVRDLMIEGPAGLKRVHPDHERPTYNPSKRKLTWDNGSYAICYSAEDPESIRGGEVGLVWCDEMAAWRYPQEAWDQLQFTLRELGDIRTVITTTPKPLPIIKELVRDPATHLTTGSSYENSSNLNQAFIDQVLKKYEGTRLGQQEIHAVILDDNPNALWKRSWLERDRVSKHPRLIRIIVAVDPAVTANENSDETGIIVLGKCADGHVYILDDVSMQQSRPEAWAVSVIAAYNKWSADRVIGEVNNGGDLIEAVLRSVDKTVSYKSVRASRGKVVRAEPVSALYEQSKAHHVGFFPTLEDQMCEWEPGMSSPDRMDALVWGVTELALSSGDNRVASPISVGEASSISSAFRRQ